MDNLAISQRISPVELRRDFFYFPRWFDILLREKARRGHFFVGFGFCACFFIYKNYIFIVAL